MSDDEDAITLDHGDRNVLLTVESKSLEITLSPHGAISLAMDLLIEASILTSDEESELLCQLVEQIEDFLNKPDEED